MNKQTISTLNQSVMKIKFQLAVIFSLLWLLTGCPYNSKVPISETKTPINEKFIGTWEKNSNGKDYFEIKKLNEQVYIIEQYTSIEVNRKFERKEFNAHLSIINNVQFVNIRQVSAKDNGANDSGYFLYRIDLSNPNVMKLMPITEFVREQFSDSASLRKFIEQNMNLSFFYEKEEIYVRRKTD